MNLTRGLPTQLTPDPIIECNFEVRFTSIRPENEVLGMLLDVLRRGYPTVEPTNLPLPIRQQDPNLQYFPDVYLKNQTFQVGVGTKALSVACKMPYAGWRRYKPEIEEKLQALLTIPSFVKSVDRVGIRYINFFEGITSADEVFDSTDMFLIQPEHKRRSLSVRTEFTNGDIAFILNTADKAVNAISQVLGCLVDLDVSCATGLSPDAPSLVNLVDRLHSEEKKVFFSLLRQELVEKFNPQYQGA